MKKIISTVLLSLLLLIAPYSSATITVINTTNSSTTSNGVPGCGSCTTTTIPNPQLNVTAVNANVTLAVDSSTQPTVSINALANSQNASSTILVTGPTGQYGYLTSLGSGLYTYTLNMSNPAVQTLTPGQTLTDSFTFRATGTGAPNITSGNAEIIVTILGPTIVPIAYPLTASVLVDLTKTSVSTSINVLTSDINAGTASVSNTTGNYGYLDLGANPSAGFYTYNVNLSNKNVLSLAAGQTLVDTFNYTIRAPGNGITTSQSTIAITLIGATNGPVANPIVANVQVNPAQTTASVSIDVLSNDSNAGNASVSNPVGQYGYLDLGSNPSAGKYTYNVNMNSPAVKALTSGQSLVDTFTYTVKGLGNSAATAQSTITINILGSTTTPLTVTAVPDVATVILSSATPSPTVTINVMGNDINGNLATLTSSPVGKYGAIVGGLSATGGLTYQVNASNAAVQQLLANPNAPALQDTFTYSISAASPNQNLTSQTTVTINIVAGNVTPFSAANFVATIIAQNATATTTSGTPTASAAVASTVTGNLQSYNATLLNITNPTFTTAITSSLFGQYGYITFSSATNVFTYTLNTGVSQLQSLLNGGSPLQDTFTYTITNSYGVTSQASIIINIVSSRQQSTSDNVEVESDDNSNLATPLNAGIYMDGSLSTASDRDFYSIVSSGNETLNLQICPPGFACNGKNGWVLYIFDGSLLTQAMQNTPISLSETRNDGGTTGPNGDGNYYPHLLYNENHMYLQYNFGVYDSALLAVIDPCFGTGTSTNVGLPILPPGTTRTYFVAVSSPLLRTNAPATGSPCGSGSVVLTKAGPTLTVSSTPTTTTSTVGNTSNTTTSSTTTVATTDQYISEFPYNTDQYTILLTRSGVSPIATNPSADQAAYNAASGVVNIPKVRVNNQLYSAQLQQTSPSLNQTSFSITNLQA